MDWLMVARSILPVTLMFDSKRGVSRRNTSSSFFSVDPVCAVLSADASGLGASVTVGVGSAGASAMGAGASCVCAVGAEASALISAGAVPSFGCSTLGAGASTVGALTAGVSGLASPSEGAGAAAAGFVSVWCVAAECPLCLRRRECDDPCPLVSGRSILPLVTNLGRMSSGISVLITSGSVLVGS